MREAFATRFRVRYAEIDGQRVVFNSRYLEYADVVVTEYWEWTGIDAALGAAWQRAEFHVRRAEVDYLKPFAWGDTIEGTCRLTKVGGSSLTKEIALHHAESGALHATVRLVSVNVDLASGRAAPIGEETRAFLATLMR